MRQNTITMRLTCILACLLTLAFSFIPVGVHSASPSPLSNAVILIVRHAEKADDGPGLTPAGQQRAVSYVHYFQSYHIGPRVLHVNHLIATADSDSSQRPRLTMEPLSKALRLPIDNRFRDKDVDALAQSLETRPGGKTILICWHHGKIPELLQDLGADPTTLLPHGKWPPNVYNWVIQLRYDANGHLIPGQARRINEHLRPGDAD
jgi:hypothetical protein